MPGQGVHHLQLVGSWSRKSSRFGTNLFHVDLGAFRVLPYLARASIGCESLFTPPSTGLVFPLSRVHACLFLMILVLLCSSVTKVCGCSGHSSTCIKWCFGRHWTCTDTPPNATNKSRFADGLNFNRTLQFFQYSVGIELLSCS